VADDYVKSLLSSGEVVLVNTRQHWIAALRFALRPILILLLAVGLFILNSWLDFDDDGLLNFINVLVGWAVWILLIVSIIWLPIDLARWWSRKYVLTNRRVTQMDGIVRKRSFDASLEQINDIEVVEPLLGRLMGYADLTIYTASDSANPTYHQLIDGIQFKKAVLTAKDAIRSGAPLTVLPEGLIVKGGTNESSMRASGKTEAPATAAASAASTETSTPSTPSEPLVEATPAPALVVEPEVEREPEAWPEADAAPVPDSEPENEPDRPA